MAQYPIISNVAVLGTSIAALKTKMVTNLTAKGIAGINVSMTLTQLIDKVLEVKYQPLARSAARSRSGIVPNIDASLNELSESLNEAHTRFKLKLEIMGVTGLTDTMTFNEYADKIPQMKTTPQYELYPRNITVGANGSYAEFYFNTTDAVKVDFAVGAGFTLDRTTGQGAGNFIIRVSGVNNTTTTAKTGTVTVTLDNGKYPSETIGVTQDAGVYTVALEQFQWGYTGAYRGTTSASGSEGCAAYCWYRCRWNGILTFERDANPHFEDLSNGFYPASNPEYLLNSNNTTTSPRTANITAWKNIEGRGKATLPVTVTQDAGSVAYTYTGVKSDGLTFNANGTNKLHPTITTTGFGATLRTIWNGIETSSEFFNSGNPQHSIQMINNGGGFSIGTALGYNYMLLASDRKITEGEARTCNVRCVYTEAGKGTFYSEYVTITQDENVVTGTSEVGATNVGKTCSGDYYCDNIRYLNETTYTSGDHSYSEYLYRTENPQHVEGQCGYVSPENIVYTYKFYNMSSSEISINGSTMSPYQYSSTFTQRGGGTIQININGSSEYSINNMQEFEIQNPYGNTFLLIPRSGYVSNGDEFTFDVV